MIPPHLFYQIYLSFLEQNDCTPPKCGELSEYTDSVHTEVEDLASRYMNGSNVYDRCGHDTRLLHPSCTACRRTDKKKVNRTKIIIKVNAFKKIERKKMFYLTTHSIHYLRLYGVGQMVKDHSDGKRGNLLSPHGQLFPISSKGSFICTNPQTG